jgi:hypothetical protein
MIPIVRHRWIAAALAALLSSTGCYKATFYSEPSAVKGEEHDRWTDFFVFGLVGTESFDVHEFCGSDPVVEVRTGGNFLTGLVGLVTIGIYMPRKVYVTCAAHGRAARDRSLEIDANPAGEPVRAQWRDGATRVAARVVAEGSGVWRVSSEATEVQR